MSMVDYIFGSERMVLIFLLLLFVVCMLMIVKFAEL